MQMQLRCGTEFYLDGLVVECILLNLRSRDLATISAVCRALRLPAQSAAYRALTGLVQRMQCTLLRHYERGSWIAQLREWETLLADNLVWLQAAASNVVTVEKEKQTYVKRVGDLSGNGYGATMYQKMPVLRADAINGYAAFEFDGRSVLKTRPFSEPLPQPVTLIVVARARGDTTIVDSLGPQSSRFEVCHGYPSGWHPSPEICMTASGNDQPPRNSLRGSTRGTGDWHVYTAVFDQRKSEMYVDGYCEASGKNVGANSLDGLSIGCDHTGVFFLTGMIAELRLYSCHMPTAQRVQTEAALARRYSLSYSCAPTLPTPPRGMGRFNCAPRSSARTADAL